MTFLNTLLATSAKRQQRISEGKAVWRAQMGHANREYEQNGTSWDEPIPYPASRMKPLPHAAHEGRVNPKGIPCLYVANNKETAMAEVRPWVGGLVSLAQLRIARDITLIDFTIGHDREFEIFLEEPSPPERAQSVWAQIGRAFSEPVISDAVSANYVPTQVIAEFIKKKGFDGVAYKSKLGPGYNIALFDLAAAEVIDCRLHPVKSVSFQFGEAQDAYTVKRKLKKEA